MASDPESPPSPQAPRRRRKLSAIMMADVSGFSRMMGADEDGTVDQINAFHRRVKDLVERFEGRVVNTAGDSVFGEFDSVVNAVECACEIQRERAADNAARAADARIEARIGIHLGDVIVEDYRVYGDGVNIAARLEPLADPGGICLSEAVYQQVRNKLELRVEDLGLKELKNIEHPIRLYRVAPTPTPTPPVSAPPRSTAAPARDAIDAGSLIRLAIAAFLLASPFILFPTGGVFPTGGAILASTVAGSIAARRTRRRGVFLVALGIGVASGALWTNWSRVTNTLFVLGGLIVAAAGAGTRRHHRNAA